MNGLGTLVLLMLLFSVITYVSWQTPIGEQKRYYYYTHAILALGLVLTIFSYVISDSQRRISAQEAAILSTRRINQHYWIDLERFFAQHAPALNRLYKQMWLDAPDVQALPDVPITPTSHMLEIHAANMLLGMISNINSEIAPNVPPDKVITTWQQPEYHIYYSTLKQWFKSEILYQRWLSSRDVYSLGMQRLIDSLR